MPGPPPTRNPRRRNARPDWRRLPAAGRPGEPPAFPIGRPTKAAAALWAQLWATPQATAWEALGWVRTVARYTKLVLASERPKAPGYLLAEVRQLEDRLGLNPMAMRRLMWEIESTPAAEAVPADVASLDDYREKLG
jgi:hypothetical protein